MTVVPPPPDQYTLDINFRGICTHFHNNVLPAIPHRVVLPQTTALRTGLVTGPSPITNQSNNPADWLFYVLLPHFQYLSMNVPGPPLTIDGVMDKGLLFTPARMVIANAFVTEISYPQPVTEEPPNLTPLVSSFWQVPSVRDFVPHYSYSTDVVMGGRTSAYFDLFGGVITAFLNGQEIIVNAQVITNGPPMLRVTPLATTDQPVPEAVIPLTNDPPALHTVLTVGNSGVSCIDERFDFLLHYLTSETGLPRALTQPLPGMINTLDPVEPDVKKILKTLEELIKSKFRPNIEDIDLQASCSDSRYP